MSLILKNLKPTGVRGMKVLDRNRFVQELSVPVLEVHTKTFNEVVKCLRKYFLKLHHFKPMQDTEVSDNTDQINKIIYLDPEKLKQWSDIKKEDQIILNSYEITEKNLREQNVKISYLNWSANHIFSAVLPEGSETCSGYEQVGHIIHLNLRDHLSEYRHLIGEVLLDKVKTCETVVTKTDSIDNQFRFFKMEVIAGRDDFIVTVKENNCTFKFDFSKVYWNSRLTAEHERIIKKVKPEDILFDIFAGVGPFSIPAARCRKATVFANDLNPESYNWLVTNAKLNKVNLSKFTAYNLDGGVFIKEYFKKFLIDVCRGTLSLDLDAKIYLTMNLPSFSYQFLKHFDGLLTNEDISLLTNEIIVHFYCFTLKTDSVAEAKKILTDNLEIDLESCVLEVIMVRDVSPSKSMMRVTFRLPKSVLTRNDSDSGSEPPNKKVCVESALK